jgi:hypothetical protein
MSVASSASTSWKLLGSGFDGLPLVVFVESSRVEFRVVRRPALVLSHNRLNAIDLGHSRGNATARVLDTFSQIFRNLSFHLERSRCFCFHDLQPSMSFNRSFNFVTLAN